MDAIMMNPPLSDLPPGADGTEPDRGKKSCGVVKNWERFANRHEALEAHRAEGIVFGCGWGEIEWLYMDYIPDEPRIDYLRRLSMRGILKSNGFKELERLKKNARKRARQQADNSKAAEPLSPEAELAATVARQKEVKA